MCSGPNYTETHYSNSRIASASHRMPKCTTPSIDGANNALKNIHLGSQEGNHRMKLASHARLTGCLMILATLTVAAPAHAGLVFGTISGQVIFVGDSVSGIAAGDPVVVSYSYDDSVVIGDVNPFVSFSLSIGTQPLTFGLADLGPTEPWFPHGRSNYYSTSAEDSIYFDLSSERAEELAGNPVSSQGMNMGIPQEFSLIGRNGGFTTYFLIMNFTATPTAAAVPEPATISMLAIGAAAVGFATRRRGRSIVG